MTETLSQSDTSDPTHAWQEKLFLSPGSGYTAPAWKLCSQNSRCHQKDSIQTQPWAGQWLSCSHSCKLLCHGKNSGLFRGLECLWATPPACLSFPWNLVHASVLPRCPHVVPAQLSPCEPPSRSGGPSCPSTDKGDLPMAGWALCGPGGYLRVPC